jgi:hypothetical protein
MAEQFEENITSIAYYETLELTGPSEVARIEPRISKYKDINNLLLNHL